MEVTTQQKTFSVQFSQLDRWNVSFFKAGNWNWPSAVIRSVGEVTNAETIPITVKEVKEKNIAIIAKINFSGELYLRGADAYENYKGKLFLVKPGRLIFSKINARRGCIHYVPKGHKPFAVSNEYPVLCVDETQIEGKYLDMALRVGPAKDVLTGTAAGMAKARTYISDIQSVKIPIPELSVQRKILAYWEAAQQRRAMADQALIDLIANLHSHLLEQTHAFEQVTGSRVFLANYAKTPQWDVKAGRAAAFISANPGFVRLGDYTEECSETVRPWEEPEKEWPIYGVNNKEGVFLSAHQKGDEFNAPYKKIEKEWFFHNPTRANVGSLGIVPEVPDDAITSPEYQVWRLHSGFLPEFMALVIRTDYFLSLVDFNRVGGVKQRMYYANLAEIRLPMIDLEIQKKYADRRMAILSTISKAKESVKKRRAEIEEMILGACPVEGI